MLPINLEIPLDKTTHISKRERRLQIQGRSPPNKVFALPNFIFLLKRELNNLVSVTIPACLFKTSLSFCEIIVKRFLVGVNTGYCAILQHTFYCL